MYRILLILGVLCLAACNVVEIPPPPSAAPVALVGEPLALATITQDGFQSNYHESTPLTVIVTAPAEIEQLNGLISADELAQVQRVDFREAFIVNTRAFLTKLV